MKRQGHLIERIADLKNLYWAYDKARKGKIAKRAVIEYARCLQTNLQALQAQILTGRVKVGNYHFFTIYDPKQRRICAAPFRQRVLHHAIMNVCHPFFERVQIFDSYASRKGKGTYAALRRAKQFHRRYAWFLKLDFRKYFDSLDHAIIKKQLDALFKDRHLLRIFDLIIDSYAAEECKGVPIGNLTSQYFANHYLAGADHFIKQILKIPAYVRYMDDLVFWHDDKTALLQAGRRFHNYAQEQLKLTLKPFCLNRTDRGMPFLGYLIYPGKVRLSFRSRSRFVKKLTEYENRLLSGVWTQEVYQRHVLPLIAFTEHAHAREFRKTVIAKFSFNAEQRPGMMDLA